jgi:peptidoglycan/xylan/chitin deacetylase (PgdA/CDA1 family)
MYKKQPPPVLIPPLDGREERFDRGYRHLVEIKAQDDAERERGIKLLKVITGDPQLPYIALTFDDGPHGPITNKMLDLLRHLKVPATFFLVGKQIAVYPEIVQRMVVEGHEIGNHTYNHYRLPHIPLEEVAPELNRTRDLVYSLIGSRIRLFRPPGGEYNAAVQRVAEQNGYATILWTDDPGDFEAGRTPKQIEGFVKRDITPGGIILLHDGIPATMKALPEIVSYLRLRGFIFVTVSELIQRGGGLLKVRNLRVHSRTTAH